MISDSTGATAYLPHINEITLSEMLPRVFIGESIPNSAVWLTNISFRRGKNYLIEAPSGGGKSSLMSYLYGNRRDFKGKLLFNGIDTATLSLPDWQEIRRRHIAYLPQDLSLFPELTALDNVRLKNALTGQVDERRIEEWMRRLGIEGRADYPARKMSIGQQQRLAIIRALCMPFDFLLLDEPVSHLDSANNLIAAEIIAEEAARRGASVISTSVGNPILLHSAINIRL